MAIGRVTGLIFTILFGVLVALMPANAQTNPAVLRITVFDTTGARVPAATVVLEETTQGFRRDTTTDSEGSVVFTNLSPSIYIATVSKEGFQSSRHESLVVAGADAELAKRTERGQGLHSRAACQRARL
jgi:uncharacterized membrane protein